jgi:hypothetical protein
MERVNLFTAVYGTYELCAPGRLGIFKVLKNKKLDFLNRFCNTSYKQPKDIAQRRNKHCSYSSLSCLGDKQENLKKCITGIALSSEDPCQECGWMHMCKISW